MTRNVPADLFAAGMEDWSRWMRSGFDLWQLSIEMTETLVASQSVIGARMRMLEAGMRGTRRLPIGEFSKLVPEKAAAFDKASSAAALAWTAPATATMGAMTVLDAWERSIASSRAWWGPLNAKATANARRLGRCR